MESSDDARAPSPALFIRISTLLIVACAAVVGLRYAHLKGWIGTMEVPWHLGDIGVWTLASFCILWGMERGAPRGMEPRPALRVYRLGVFLSAMGMLGVWIYA